MGRRLVLIDGAGFLWRCFHAYPERRSPEGLAIHAVEGLIRMTVRPLLEKGLTTHAAVIFEHGGLNFRHKLYPSYKSHRSPVPPDLISQIPLARLAVEAYGVHALSAEGFEADDLIATLAHLAQQDNVATTIVSHDKDLLQLVGGSIKVYDPSRKEIYDEAGVEKRLGVKPSQVVDWLALAGDAADGFPGVPGIGPKIAADLLKLGESLEQLCLQPALIGKKYLREALIKHQEYLPVYRQLAELRKDVPFDRHIESLRLGKRDAIEFLRTHNFPHWIA